MTITIPSAFRYNTSSDCHESARDSTFHVSIHMIWTSANPYITLEKTETQGEQVIFQGYTASR